MSRGPNNDWHGEGANGGSPQWRLWADPSPSLGAVPPCISPPLGLPQATKNLLHKAHTRRRKAHIKSRSLSRFCFGFGLGFSFGLIWHKVSVSVSRDNF